MGNMRLGAQLYTVRMFTQTPRDFRAAVKKIAAIGYTEAQLSAVGPIKPRALREICDEHGMAVALTHTNPDRILDDTDAVIREHDELGCKYIGIGMMQERYRNADWLGRFAADYLEPAKKIAAAGKLLMYHNHAFEFAKIGGKRVLDFLAESFAPDEMGFTLDVYWVHAAGADAVKMIRSLKGRLPCVHLKDMEALASGASMTAPVLEGNMDFEQILQALEEDGGVDHLLVEQDDCRESPFACLEKSYGNLAALGYK